VITNRGGYNRDARPGLVPAAGCASQRRIEPRRQDRRAFAYEADGRASPRSGATRFRRCFETTASTRRASSRKEIDHRRGSGRIEHYGEQRLLRVDLDEDRDSRFDLWNFYDPQGRLEKQEQDRDGDGRPDTWVTLDVETGKETRLLEDSNGDGKIDTWRSNDPSGVALSLEEDKNGDEKPDRLVKFAGGAPASFEEDTDFDGKPDLRGTLAPDGRLLSEQRSTGSAAGFDLEVVYRDGEKIREEKDTDGDGKANVVTSFERGIETLQEQDTTGDGKFDTRIY
jgi:hypothetical protein